MKTHFKYTIILVLIFFLSLPILSANDSSEKIHLEKLHDISSYLNTRDYTTAIRMLLKLNEQYPDSVDILMVLGDSYLTIEEFCKAESIFRRIKSLDPLNSQAQKKLWEIELDKNWNIPGNKEIVRKKIDAFYSLNKESVSGLETAFCGYLLLEDKEMTDKILGELQKHSDTLNPFPCLESDLYRKILEESDPDKAINYCSLFIQYFPDNDEIDSIWEIYLFALALNKKDQTAFDKRASEWISARNTARAYYITAYNMVYSNWELRQAITYLREALNCIEHPSKNDKLPGMSEKEFQKSLLALKGKIYDLLAWAYFKNGDDRNAIRNIEEAAEIASYDPIMHAHASIIYNENNTPEKALHHVTKALMYGYIAPELIALSQKLLNEKGFRGTLKDYFLKSYPYLPSFIEATQASGIPDVSATRIAWGDYNGDGWEDLLLGGSTLLKNNKGTFTDVTGSVFSTKLNGNGGLWADFTNDGFLDFYMMSRGNQQTGKFFKNIDGKRFIDITDSVCATPCYYPTEGAAWMDINNDGFVDIYLANYEKPGRMTKGTRDMLLINSGGKKFTNNSENITNISREPMCGRGVVASDLNNDGFADIYVCNYRLDPNYLLINNQDNTFTNMARSSKAEGNGYAGYFGHSIGADIADYDTDGDPDIFSANLAHPRNIGFSDTSMLLTNTGKNNILFIDSFSTSGIQYDETHSDPSWGDIDNDGDEDLFITSVYPGRKAHLYLNDNGHFVDVTWFSGINLSNCWGAAFADYDHDGDLDLAVASNNKIHLLENRGNTNNWIGLYLIGTTSNRSAIGAKAVIQLGKKRLSKEVQGGKGTGNQHSLPLEFGLGRKNRPVKVTIFWPSGKKQIIKNLAPNRYHNIVEE